MPDTQQIESEYPKYRYTIPQLLALACTACLPFDLSKFTYEAARAGVIPSLESCTMASRKSSAAYTNAGNIDTASNSDVLVFRGNKLVQPGRQPKIPPPVERQKDEGFARFLKKHASPTHNRVTAGGRIVPMEPRSPPVFALSSAAVNGSQAALATQDEQAAEADRSQLRTQALENQRLYQTADWPSQHHMGPFPMVNAQPVVEPSNNTMPMFMPYQSPSSLMHAQMFTEYPVEPFLMSVQDCSMDHHMGGPVMPHHMHGRSLAYNPYYSPSAMGSTVPVSNEFGSSPTWSAFDHNLGLQDVAHNMTPGYQLLVAWQQHYSDLDIQLKNIDRHRAMHQLDPYLAEQRKGIVQKRSDAKDAIKECQMLLGLRRMTDTSQDSFATSFNVDAPSYVPARIFDSTESQIYPQSVDTAQGIAGTEKPKGNATRRAIPIVSPPKPTMEDTRPQGAVRQDSFSQGLDVDEWGVQNRPAPPEIHRQQSRLSDMIQAEQRRSASGQDDDSHHDRNSQSSVGSQQGVAIDRRLEVIEANIDLALSADPQVALDELPLPRDNADEIHKVMDAVSKPKGTITRVRLLDNRIIDVEGQGLSLSAVEHSPRKDRIASSKTDTKGPTPSLLRSKVPQEAHTHVTDTNQVATADRSVGKENILVAPQGHQKAATDAFLAQFNAVEDNVALATRADNSSLNVSSNGLVENRKRSRNNLSTPNNFSTSESIGKRFANVNLNTQRELSKSSAADQDSTSFQTATSTFADDLLNKGYSSVSVQNVNAIGRLPQNFDGAVDARQMAQAHLAAAEKAKSPRLFKRQGANGSGAWYGPFSRDMFERARMQSHTGRTPKKQNF